MNDNLQTSTVMNRIEDELTKLRREQRSRNISAWLCIAVSMIVIFSGSSRESDFSKTFLLIFLFATAVDSLSIRRSIRMMESIAAMFPKRISGSEQSAA